MLYEVQRIKTKPGMVTDKILFCLRFDGVFREDTTLFSSIQIFGKVKVLPIRAGKQKNCLSDHTWMKPEMEAFMLKHGENVVDCLGEQVDRLEKELKEKHPDVRHVDLEVL